MESVISIIGSIASVFGAFWALWEASKAKGWADKAEQVRNELIERRKMVEVSRVHAETIRILRTVAKVGPSCNEQLIKGVNCAEIASDVGEYVRFILEQSEHFAHFFSNEAKALADDLKVDVEALSEAKDFTEKKGRGKSIYYKILAFMPAVKRLSDEKLERDPNE